MRNKMKLYKKNLRYFKEKKPDIYSFIKDSSISDVTYSQIENSFVIKTGNAIYIEENDINKILYNNLEFTFYFPQYKENKNLKDYIHSKLIESIEIDFDPDTLKENFSRAVIKHKYFPVTFINGLGTGRILSKLTEEIKTDLIIIYEPDPYKFVVSMYHVDYQIMFEKFKLYIIIGSNEDIIRRSIKEIITSNNPVLIPFLAKVNLYKNNQYCKKFDSNLKKALILSIKGWGFYDDEKIALKHGLENLKDNPPYLFRPSRKLENSTAFIVASGPSLEKNIDFIKKNKDKAVIFSCGTALHKLYRENIVPDFHIELERETIRKDILEMLPLDYLKKINLIAADVIHPDIKKMFKTTYLFFREGAIHTKILKPVFIPPAITPTVTNTATSIAIISGFENIIFFGADMGFKEKEKKHVTGTIFDNKKYRYIEEMMDDYLEVKGNFGGTVYTTDILLWSKEHLEILISAFKDRNFYNCSDGAKIESAKPVKDPADINIPQSNKDIVLKNMHSLFSSDLKSITTPDSSNFFDLSMEMISRFESHFDRLSFQDFEKLIEFLNSEYSLVLSYREHEVPYILLSGTLKTILMYIYKLGIIFSGENSNKVNEIKSKILNGLSDIKDDLTSIKPYLDGSLITQIYKDK
ncbi:motility associated factor glycosyltransferase family protein [Persephonella sp.]